MAELIESQGGKVELRTKSLEINLSGEDKVKVKVETNGQIEE